MRWLAVREQRRCCAGGWVLSLSVGAGGCATQQVTVPLIPPFIPAPRPPIVWTEPFTILDPQRWREVEVRGQTQYAITVLEDRTCLQATSRGGASILLSAVRFDPEDYPWISWDWRVDRLVEGEALQRKEGSDAAARLYVYFESKGLPWQKRNLDYVWSASLPVGTILSSAYSSESKIIVVESGPAHLGQWRSIQRNLEEDYEQCFGDDPPDVIAIGLMTDTDNTASHALAYFDELRISRLPAPRQQADQENLP